MDVDLGSSRWRKHTAIGDNILRIGFEAVFEKEAQPFFEEKYFSELNLDLSGDSRHSRLQILEFLKNKERKMIHCANGKETSDKIYFPSNMSCSEMYNGMVGGATYFVPIVASPNADHYNVVLQRKNRFINGRLPLMVCGREGEKEPFGFSLWKEGKPRDRFHVSLVAPNKSGVFNPVYIFFESGSEEALKLFRVEVRNPVIEPAKGITFDWSQRPLADAPKCLRTMI